MNTIRHQTIGYRYGVPRYRILGAPVAGWVFDRRGSYDGVWTVFAGLNVAAMLLVATMPRKAKGTGL
ncbi:MAG: hypothetical protein Q8P24_05000 [Desulfobacterales bacterium]|nr:hypothetical protein [Desulfobacterales bacterium]